MQNSKLYNIRIKNKKFEFLLFPIFLRPEGSSPRSLSFMDKGSLIIFLFA
jgi:hypothetical protein